MSTRGTIIKNTFHEFKIYNDITIQPMNIWMVICVFGENFSCLLWANTTISDGQSLVSSTTRAVEIDKVNRIFSPTQVSAG